MIQAYLRKLENFQISNLTLQLKKQENEEQVKTKPKIDIKKKNQTPKNISRKKERKKDQRRNKWRQRKERIGETMSWF